MAALTERLWGQARQPCNNLHCVSCCVVAMCVSGTTPPVHTTTRRWAAGKCGRSARAHTGSLAGHTLCQV